MKKLFKVTLIVLPSLSVIFVVGLFIFLKTFDVNRFKPQIIAAGQNALGRVIVQLQKKLDDICHCEPERSEGEAI